MPVPNATDLGVAVGDPFEPLADDSVAVPDEVLSAGLGVALTAVLDSGPADLANDLEADLEAVLEVDASVLAPLIAPALASLTAVAVDGSGTLRETAPLVTEELVLVAKRLPAAQRARLAELAKAQYGLCPNGHHRSVRVRNSGRDARTELYCRICGNGGR